MSETEKEIVETEDIEKVETETVETDTEESKTGKSYPTQTLLAIRALVGGYILYLAYGLFTSKDELTPLMWGAAIVFIVAGVALVVLSVKHFICGEYEGGRGSKEGPEDREDSLLHDEHHLR